jgi:hypothetical protein
MPTPSKVGQFIRRRREELGLTQRQLGVERLHFKYGNFVGMIETGQSKLPDEIWESWADALELKPEARLEFLRLIIEENYPHFARYMQLHEPRPAMRITGSAKDLFSEPPRPKATHEVSTRAKRVESTQPLRVNPATGRPRTAETQQQGSLFDDDDWPASP